MSLSVMLLSVLDQSPIRAGCTPSDALQETQELAEFCDRLGYHRYWLAEHHSTGGLAGSAPEILIGQIAARTHNLRVGSGGIMLSHYSALKVAENFRMLETLYPGRIDLGIGRAPGSDGLTASALAHGPGALGIEHFPAQIRDVQAWINGDMPDDHPFKQVTAMPAGETSPEIWLLGSSDQSAAYAAYFGMAFSFAHFINAQGGPLVMEAYRRHFEPSRQVSVPRGSVGIFVVCADTEEEALELRWSRDLWTLRLRTGQTGPVPTVEEAKNYPYTQQEWAIVQQNRSRTIAGNPEQCAARIGVLGDEYNVNEFVIVTICDKFSARLRSYELLADSFALASAHTA
ncbi:MAG: LLM class flavin-dependent oxidoreductase [Pseudomonadota bacterium]|nr:LLM class flavin-dependent oxidoreductase [Pseudomonadota bacterium]